MKFTEEHEIDFKNATVCHLCNKILRDDKVRNHNHITGEYLGAAHNVCNPQYKVPKHIPCFFHNLTSYDVHHLVQRVGKYKDIKLHCIAKSSEKYMSLSWDNLRFLNSLQFLNAPLDTLVNNLSKFDILKECFGNDIDLLRRKGVFPYSWLTYKSKFNVTSLPPKENFYNELRDEEISNEDYNHTQTVWKTFRMQTFKEYHDLYLKLDTLQLACVFENFREMSLNYYGIDPFNVYSAPGLAWHSMLKMTGVKLELFTDIDMHLFIERGVRGGVSMIPNRYAEANNPYVSNFYQEKPTNYLIYLDATNLYGHSLSQPLPHSEFRWLDENEFPTQEQIINLTDDCEYGCILEVDLEYTKELHDLHSDYPLAPEYK